MVSVRFNLFALHQTEQFLPSNVSPFALNFLCRAAHSFVHEPDRNLKRLSEGLRNNFCASLQDNCAEFVWYFMLSLRVAALGKLKTVTTCSRFIRALVAACLGSNIVYPGNTFVPRKSLCFSLLFSFKEREWPNSEDGIHWYDPSNERRDWNSRGGNGYSTLEMTRDKNFNFITLDWNGGNKFEAYAVRISCRGFF